MKSTRLLLVVCLFTAFTNTVFGQKNKLSLGTQIPMNYSVAYEEQLYGGFYLNYHFGLLAQPYVKVLFHEAEKRGLNQSFSSIIEGYFQRGICHQFQLKYAPQFLKGFYVGALFKRKKISAVGIPYQEAANELGVELPVPDDNPILLALLDDLDFDITMTIPGAYIGKSIKLGKSNWSVYLELSFQKIINSNSAVTFTGQDSEISLLSTLLNDEVSSALDEDGNLFTFNCGISYTLPFSINRAITDLLKRKKEKKNEKK